MCNAAIVDAYRFMRRNAGYVVGENARGALELARAERRLAQAVELGVATVTWEWDDQPYDFDPAVDSPQEVAQRFESGEWTGPFGCVVETDADVASLWGIVVGPRGTRDDYCRVVEAELALEADDSLRQSIGDALDSLRAAETLLRGVDDDLADELYAVGCAIGAQA